MLTLSGNAVNGIHKGPALQDDLLLEREVKWGSRSGCGSFVMCHGGRSSSKDKKILKLKLKQRQAQISHLLGGNWRLA